jgi:hypothetical protein
MPNHNWKQNKYVPKVVTTVLFLGFTNLTRGIGTETPGQNLYLCPVHLKYKTVGLNPGRGRIFPPASVSRPVLRSTQPAIQRVERVLSPGAKRGRDVTLTTHPIY